MDDVTSPGDPSKEKWAARREQEDRARINDMCAAAAREAVRDFLFRERVAGLHVEMVTPEEFERGNYALAFRGPQP